MTYPRSLSSKKYPEFIRESLVFKAYPRPEKVFPRIGLRNCEVSLKSIKIYESFSDKLLELRDLHECRGSLSDHLLTLSTFLEDFDYMPYITKKFFGLKNPTSISGFMSAVNGQLKKHKIDKKFFLSDKNTSKPADKILLPKNKNIKLFFSSNGPKGYWDIATMSMRGIQSCMNWKNDNSHTLIGSIADPYTGIIYIGDKAKNQMLARSVVRFVVDEDSGKPSLLIERVYINGYLNGFTKIQNGSDIRDICLSIFSSFLRSKTNLKVISSVDDADTSQFTIPLSKITNEILCLTDGEDEFDNADNSILSYRDSGIEYGKIQKYFDPKKIKITK